MADEEIHPLDTLERGETAIFVENGMVLQVFCEPVNGMRYAPENARLVGEQMGRCAYEAHFGREPPDSGSALAEYVKMKGVDELRPQLIARAQVMLRSLINQKVDPRLIARDVVDAVLKEVT